MKYHLRQALMAVRLNITATLATLTTMTLTLVMLGFVVLLSLNVDRSLSQLESQVEISAFLRDGVDGQALVSQIQTMDKVKSVELKTSEQVLDDMVQVSPDLRELSDIVGNPYPNTIKIKTEHVADTKMLAPQISSLPGIENIEYGAAYVDKTVRTLSAIRGAAYVLVGLLLMGTFFNILNAVRVAIYARRNEINVMRLLGATRGFIQMPHIIEGVSVGFLAAFIAIIVLSISYIGLINQVKELAPMIPVVTEVSTISLLFLFLAILGVSLGLFGSIFASRRYLKELE